MQSPLYLPLHLPSHLPLSPPAPFTSSPLFCSASQVGKVVKLWRGVGTEVFTDAASYDLQFPLEQPNSLFDEAQGIDETAKARLLGSTLFINTLFF